MATRYQVKFLQFQKALDTLDRALEQEKNEFIRDSIIQRFEYSVELFWKMIKEYLYEYENIEVKSPNQTIREGRNVNIFTETEVEYALEMIHDRNQLSHAYDEEVAENISENIPEYTSFMRKFYLQFTDKNK